MSRSGATLTAARLRGFRRRDAHALSWHAALPVILGAGALKGAPLALARARGRTRRRAARRRRGERFRVHAREQPGPARVRAGDRPLLPYSLYRCLLAALVIARMRAGRTARVRSIYR